MLSVQCRARPQGASVGHVFETDRVAASAICHDTDCCHPVLQNMNRPAAQSIDPSHLMSHDEHVDDTRCSVAPVNQPVALVAQ